MSRSTFQKQYVNYFISVLWGGVIFVALAFYPGACRVVSSIGTWWARFVMWVTTFPFLKFLPGFGTKYKFLDLDVFDFNILVGGGTSRAVILNDSAEKFKFPVICLCICG